MTVLTTEGIRKRIAGVRALAASLLEEAARDDVTAAQADDPMVAEFYRTNAQNARRAAEAFEKDANDLEIRFLTK